MKNVNFVLFLPELRPFESLGFQNFLRLFWSDSCGEKLGDRNHAKHLSSCCVSSGPFSAVWAEFGQEVMKKLQTLIILVLLAQIRVSAHKANT